MSKAPDDVLLRVEGVLKIVPVGRATWYRLIKEREELKPLKIGRGSFWKKSSILDLIKNLEEEQL